MMIELGANNYNMGLHAACEGGNVSIVKMMLELGADDYNWGLELACEKGHVEVVKIMIELGANDYFCLKYGNLELKILYIRLSRRVINLPIKKQHPEYHLLKIYGKKVPDIDRLINKYLF